MPTWFIISIIVAILAALTWAGGYLATTQRPVIRVSAVVLAGIALLCLILSSFDIVSTRNVGIVTTFGKPTRETGAGLQPHWPWQKVSEMDAAIQLQSFQGNNFGDPQNAVKVRLGNNSTAYVEANLNWRIKENAAGQMFQDYRTFDNIRANLVDKQLQVALSKHFATFNPQLQATVDPTKPSAPTTIPAPNQGADLPGIAAEVKDDLQHAVGTEITIIDVRIPGIFYDDPTQKRIDEFNQKVQETKNAQQDVQTATQNRLASEQRAMQVPPDLRVAIFNCINKQVENGKDPAGCWGQIGTGGNPLIQIPVPQS